MIFNLRLAPDLQDRLAAAAKRRGISRSEIAREALELHLDELDGTPPRRLEIDDDWSEFGREIVAAQQTVLRKLIVNLDHAEWAEAVEPAYQVFREMTVAKSRAYQNPWISTFATEPPFDPVVVAALGFAADDVHEITVDLEQALFEYGWFAGDKALGEVPEICARARERLLAGEPDPDEAVIRATRARGRKRKAPKRSR
jgi:hypothetical protein